MSAYQLLQDRFKRIGALAGAESMLYWDMATMMPPGGAEGVATLREVLVVDGGMLSAAVSEI